MTKIKALGLGLLAVLAVSGFSVMNATAETGGHFTHDATTNHATIIGTETVAPTEHRLEFTATGSGIVCDEVSYHGSMAAKTVESVTITPSWSKCHTTDSSTLFEVHENGCQITFTIGREGQVAKDHTTHLICPKDKTIVITHQNCAIHVPPQTPGGGVVYDTDVQNNKHAITLTATAEVTAHYESGICIFLGTTHLAKMEGSATVVAEDTNKNRVNLTATTGPKK